MFSGEQFLAGWTWDFDIITSELDMFIELFMRLENNFTVVTRSVSRTIFLQVFKQLKYVHIWVVLSIDKLWWIHLIIPVNVLKILFLLWNRLRLNIFYFTIFYNFSKIKLACMLFSHRFNKLSKMAKFHFFEPLKNTTELWTTQLFSSCWPTFSFFWPFWLLTRSAYDLVAMFTLLKIQWNLIAYYTSYKGLNRI